MRLRLRRIFAKRCCVTRCVVCNGQQKIPVKSPTSQRRIFAPGLRAVLLRQFARAGAGKKSDEQAEVAALAR